MNLFIAKGRLIKDVTTRWTTDSKPIVDFNLAVNRSFKRENEPEADFFRFRCFGKTAELADKYLRKGSEIIVSAHVQNNNWIDKDNVQHYDFAFVADSIEFCGKKAEGAGEGTPKPEAAVDENGFMNIPDGGVDDLPFA